MKYWETGDLYTTYYELNKKPKPFFAILCNDTIASLIYSIIKHCLGIIKIICSQSLPKIAKMLTKRHIVSHCLILKLQRGD